MPAQPVAGLPSGSASALQPSEHKDFGGAGWVLQILRAEAAILFGHGGSQGAAAAANLSTTIFFSATGGQSRNPIQCSATNQIVTQTKLRDNMIWISVDTNKTPSSINHQPVVQSVAPATSRGGGEGGGAGQPFPNSTCFISGQHKHCS